MKNKNNGLPGCQRTPKLYLWSREALFLGTCHARQEAHKTTQETLVVCLKGSINLRMDNGSKTRVKSCLLSAGAEFEKGTLDASNAVVAIYYLAPFSQDHAALASIMQPATDAIHCGHREEESLIDALIDIRNARSLDASAARKHLREVAVPADLRGLTFRLFDPRIVRVASLIRQTMLDPMSLNELAEEVSLSESRLEKLFKDQAGIPITQYRMRYRVFISSLFMAQGYSVTEAALAAGFSSSAHLSRSYRALNGIPPSVIFMNPPFMETILDKSARALLEPLTGHAPTA